MEPKADDLRRSQPGSRRWEAEYVDLAARDHRAPLEPAELERMAMAAFLLGRETDSIDILTRAHQLSMDRGDSLHAARCAVWAACALMSMGERARAAGWAGRARRLLDEDRHDCVERGYLAVLHAIERVGSGDISEAERTFADAERIGERFGDPDLTSLARQGHGRTLVALGRTAEGVALFDEVMVAVTSGELTPLIAGIVYCSVISACFDICDLRRAQEWTDALNDWCASQPDVVSYRGECQVHRAEILRLHGQWPEAFDEARRAYDTLPPAKRTLRGSAMYEIAELHRHRGDFAEAEEAYRLTSDCGRSPHPGLALMRLAQARHSDASAAIARVMAEPARGRMRADVLAAGVEILLACEKVADARRAADELTSLAGSIDTPYLRAVALGAEGAVRLGEGEARSALTSLRQALAIWRELQAPYAAARVTVLIGQACRALADTDGARMECEAAATAFRSLGAARDLARMDSIATSGTLDSAACLTAREVDVLRLVARGKTNRTIAQDLDISEKTVARHIANIFTKLDLSTRAAATAYAFIHRLVE
jgi:DNA-binding NarL/FixJ family response regulator